MKKKEFNRAFIEPSDCIFPKRIVCPDEIIEYIKSEKPVSSKGELLINYDEINETTVSQQVINKLPDDTVFDEANQHSNQPVIQFPAFDVN